MKSITIHGVDEQLALRLKQLAEEHGTSVNRTVKRLLEQALGMKPRPRHHNRDQFEAFSGLWSPSELREFEEATSELARTDPGDWQ